jgi:ABC-type uncharacterized transport system substrate-binding protein
MLNRLVITCVLGVLFSASAGGADPKAAKYRILHVMSYHATWKWNRDQFDAFKSVLHNYDVEYKVVELDTKRHSNPIEINKKVATAVEIIDAWKPHLIYANDDNAQKYLARNYVNSEIPIVFSGVNRNPLEYGFVASKNVTGILEHEHIIPTFKLLLKLVPDVKRVAVIVDSDPTWKGVMERLQSSVDQIPQIQITQWHQIETLQQFRTRITELQDEVDAIAMLGVFNIKDESGSDVDYGEILRWVAENSELPDFSFWQSRVERGTLCAVAVSGYEQGLLAGMMARSILINGINPADIAIQSSTVGVPMINLARLRKLGINPDVNLLLNIKTVSGYAWESEAALARGR